MGGSQSRGCGDCAGEEVQVSGCADLSKTSDDEDSEFGHDEQQRLPALNVCIVCKMHADTRCKACETFWYCSQACQETVTTQLSN